MKEVFDNFDQAFKICTGNISKSFLNQLEVYSFVLKSGHNKFSEIDLMCVGFPAWDSSIGAVTGLCWTTHESWFYSRQRQEIFLSSKASRPKMEPTQPPSQCLLEEISPRTQWLFMKLTTHIHLGQGYECGEQYLRTQYVVLASTEATLTYHRVRASS